jgi:NAD dependent epimerase/dehydratase
MNWKNVRVVVTGAGGFIGSHLTEELARRGAKVRALVHYNSRGHWGFLEDLDPALKPRVEVRAGDVADPNCMAELIEGSDVVFHLAALIAIPYSYRAPASYVRTNVEGTANLLQAARDAGVSKTIVTSTSEVYGTARQIPIGEDHPLQAQSPYAATKIAADMLADAFRRSFALPVRIVRPFNTYGPRQSARAVIPTIITQALADEPIRLGHIAPTRDFTFVADTVEGFIKMAEVEADPDGPVHLGTGQETSIGALARAILDRLGSRSVIVTDAERERPDGSEVERLCADATRARTLLGWTAHSSLDEGLGQTIEWFRQHRHRYREGVYGV